MPIKRLHSKLASTWFASMLFRPMEHLYTRLSRDLFFHILVVAVIPTLFMGIGVYYQFKVMAEQEQKNRLNWQMRHTQKAADRFLEEHMATLRLLFSSHAVEEFKDQKKLQHIFSNLKQEFPNFVDLGLVDSTGRQNTYDGPYKLLGKNCRGEEWFQDVLVRGTFISDVFFMENQQIPHVLMAVKSPPSDTGEFWVVRAAVNTEVFDQIVGAMNWGDEDDTFILNKRSLLQNTSRFHGSVLSRHYMPMHETAQNVVWTEETEVLTHEEKPRTDKAVVIYTSLQNKNWALTYIQPHSEWQKYFYPVRRIMIGVMISGFVFVFMLSWLITKNFAVQLEKSEKEKNAVLKAAEHTDRLASIGRLAAGVAHEINNPLAIINEKAGLMKDLTELSDDFANKEKFEDLLRSIHTSVTRCRTITHRLLGFARRMDVSAEVIDINALIHEVLGFLNTDALLRDVEINLDLAEDLPTIESDRGQLQQVFLNIINNAMDAVTLDKDESYKGELIICTWQKDEDTVGVKICDNGCGIPQNNLKGIFDPFYSTKARGKGTGLGLSITHGIIDKLGGKILVESDVNQGTAFTIELPRSSNL